MTYRVVFDLMQSGYRTWWFPMFGVAFLVVASVVVVARRRGAFVGRGFGRVLPYGLLTFAAIWTSGAFMATYGEYRHLVAALQNGEAQVVEGIVTDFKPIPPQGHADERFTVAGHTFSYSDYVTTSAFCGFRKF